MNITSHGKLCVKLQTDNASVLVDPFGGKDGMRAGQQADIVLVSSGDTKEAESLVKEGAMIISTPGEYETKGVFVYGVPEVDGGGALVGRTFFVVKAEGVNVGVLGYSKQAEVASSQEEIIEGVDVLIVPIGGNQMLNVKEAVQMVNQIEPRLVVPVGFAKGEEAPFLKALGAKTVERGEKLKVTLKNLPQEDMHFFVFDV